MKALTRYGIILGIAGIVSFWLLYMAAFGQAQQATPIQVTAFSDSGMEIVSPNIERTCNGNTCTAIVHSAPKWIHNGTRYVNFTDYVKVSFTTDGFNFSWPSGWAVFEPAVNYSGTVYYWSDLPALAKSSIAKAKPLKNNKASWQWGFNLTLPQTIANNLNNFSFRLVSTSEGVRLEGYNLISDSGIMWNFADLIDKGYTVQMSNDTVWVGNLTGKTMLDLDPTASLGFVQQGSSPDSTVGSFSPNTNYNGDENYALSIRRGSGDYFRSYIRFNLSEINSSITSVTTANTTLMASIANGGTVAAYFVNDTAVATFSETTITWNNQPCGTTTTSLNGSCNQTQLSSLNIDTNNNNYTFDVTNAASWIIRNVAYPNQIMTILLANISSAAAGPNLLFYSKNNANNNIRPYLNITYTTNTAPNAPTLKPPANNTRVTGTTINLTYVFSDPDSGDTLTNFIWFGSTNPPPFNTSTAGNGSGNLGLIRGTQYWWTVSTGDGTANSSNASIQNFSVNILPSTATPQINISRPLPSNSISCNATITDSDNATVQTYVQWFNGTSLNNAFRTVLTTGISNNTNTVLDTIMSGNMTRGDKWLCQVTPYDGLENGTASNSTSVTINSLPTVPTLSTPANASRNTGNAINLTWAASTDADSDSITYFVFFGTSNPPAFNLSATSPFSGSLGTTDGQSYYWIVLSGDPYENQTSNSSTFQFSENALASTNTPSLNTTRTLATDAVKCTATITDSDNGTVGAYVQWFNGTGNSNLWRQARATGVSNATATDLDTLPSPFVRADTWLCRVIPEDALENGTASNSTAILVNTLPSASEIAINNTSPTYADLFGANGTVTDQDNSTVQTYVSWYNGSALYRTRLVTGIPNATNSNLDAIAGGIARKSESWLAATTPYDGLENGTQSNSSSITMANTAPTITHALPANNTNTTVRATIFAINFTDPDAETNWTTIFYVNNGTDYAIGRNFSASVNATNISITSNISLADSKYTWFVRVNDTTANTASASFNITIDNAAPAVTIALPANTTYSSGTRTLNLSASDSLTSVSAYLYYLNSTGNISFSPNITFTASEGQRNITVYVNDTLNNVNATAIYFTVDLTNPAAGIIQSSPACVEANQTLTITSAISDNIALKRSNITRLSPAAIETTTDTGTGSSASMSFQPNAAGSWQFTVKATDNADRTGSATGNVTVSATGACGGGSGVGVGGGGGGGGAVQEITLPAAAIVKANAYSLAAQPFSRASADLNFNSFRLLSAEAKEQAISMQFNLTKSGTSLPVPLARGTALDWVILEGKGDLPGEIALEFTVPKASITTDADSVILARYDGTEWQEFPATAIASDESQATFRSTAACCSLYAIVEMEQLPIENFQLTLLQPRFGAFSYLNLLIFAAASWLLHARWKKNRGRLSSQDRLFAAFVVIFAGMLTLATADINLLDQMKQSMLTNAQLTIAQLKP